MDVTKLIKHLLGAICVRTRLYRRFLRGRAIVVLFHRVDDRYPTNPISCTQKEFAGYCDFFHRYFDVIPLSELLEDIQKGTDLTGKLVITFDDGYRDNATAVAEILRERGLPACFFIATNFVGSDQVTWWDRDRGIESQWMDWDQVRTLRASGFEIGAHTMNHVDLGVVEQSIAEAEITGSRQRLEKELGETVRLFSYPYGRREQITEQARQFVSKSGFSCCMSAFGGFVDQGSDVFRVHRVAISPYYVSPYHFLFDMLREA